MRCLAPLAAAIALAGPAMAEDLVKQPPAAAQEQVAKEEATNVLGQKVMSQGGEDIGRIVDILVDDQGRPRAAVIDFGGFMGIGNRKVAVAWRALRFAPTEEGAKRITLEMTADQIKATPNYVPSGKPVTMAAPPAPPVAEPALAPASPETRPETRPDAR